MTQHINKLLLIVFCLISSCDYRTPSDIRMERHTKLELPDNITVLKDEYVDAGKDYSIQYNVVVDDSGMKKVTQHIRSSKNYSIDAAEKNGAWISSGKGYYFFLAEEGISYELIVDTTTNVIYYNEAG